MPLPAGSSVVEISVLSKLDGQRVINIYHFFAPTGNVTSTKAFADLAATAFFNDYVSTAAYRAIFNPLYLIQEVHFQIIWPTRIATGLVGVIPGLAGTRVGTPLPSSCQWSATTFSNAAGPGGHGGNRYAGFNIDDQEESILTDAFKGDAQTWTDIIYDQITLDGIDYFGCIYRRADPANSEPMVGSLIEDEVRTMRRRVVGRGI